MTKQRTPFGEQLRRLRLERGETLGAIATAVGASVAMVSAVEVGRKPASDSLIDRLIGHFGLTEKEAESFRDLAVSSRRRVEIDLDQMNSEQRETAAVFARRFASLSDNNLSKLKEILETDGE